MPPQFTFSCALDRFLSLYPARSSLDRNWLLEVFANGGWRLLDGRQVSPRYGQGIIVTISSDAAAMHQQLHDALAYLAASPSQPQSYVQEKVGKAYEMYLTESERIFL